MENKFTKEFILQALDLYREDLNARTWCFEETVDDEVYINTDKYHSFYMGDLETVDKCCYHVGEYVIDAGNNYRELLLAHLELLDEVYRLKNPFYNKEAEELEKKYYSEESEWNERWGKDILQIPKSSEEGEKNSDI